MSIKTFFSNIFYSRYINFSNDVDYGTVSKYAEKVAFIASQEAYHRAKGIASFPDGGQPKVILHQKGIYLYDFEKERLTHLKKLWLWQGQAGLVRAREKLLFLENTVYYEREIHNTYGSAKNQALSLKKEHDKAYSINIKTKEITPIDFEKIDALYKKHHTRVKIDLSTLEEIHLSEWGLMIEDIYPKHEKEYLKELIQLKNNHMVRRAIVEQILAKKSRAEIKEILEKMNLFYQGLDINEKVKCSISLFDTSQYIRKLFNIPRGEKHDNLLA